MIGYLSVSKDYAEICELSLNTPGLLAEVIGVYLGQYRKEKWPGVVVDAYPTETSIIAQLSKLAESVTVTHANHFNIMDYPAVLGAFLKLKCETAVLPEGKLTMRIGDDLPCNITISVTDNCPSVSITDNEPDLTCTHVEAMQILFSPVSAFNLGQLEKNLFARGLLPIPLYVKKIDQS